MQLFPIGRVYAFEPMKTIIPLLALAALCGSSSIASAQQPAGTPPAREEKDKPMDWKKYRDQMEKLPEDVRKRFHEAKEEAMKDPEIQALREKTESAAKELREAMRKVISEKNPDLAEQLTTYFKTSQSEPKSKDKKPHRDQPLPFYGHQETRIGREDGRVGVHYSTGIFTIFESEVVEASAGEPESTLTSATFCLRQLPSLSMRV